MHKYVHAEIHQFTGTFTPGMFMHRYVHAYVPSCICTFMHRYISQEFSWTGVLMRMYIHLNVHSCRCTFMYMYFHEKVRYCFGTVICMYVHAEVLACRGTLKRSFILSMGGMLSKTYLVCAECHPKYTKYAGNAVQTIPSIREMNT